MTISQDEVAEVNGTPIERLDFSQFHPLDHSLFDPRCGRLPGGMRRHLSLWWAYMRPRPVQAVLCRLGRHSKVGYWISLGATREAPDERLFDGYECDYCLVEIVDDTADK